MKLLSLLLFPLLSLNSYELFETNPEPASIPMPAQTIVNELEQKYFHMTFYRISEMILVFTCDLLQSFSKNGIVIEEPVNHMISDELERRLFASTLGASSLAFNNHRQIINTRAQSYMKVPRITAEAVEDLFELVDPFVRETMIRTHAESVFGVISSIIDFSLLHSSSVSKIKSSGTVIQEDMKKSVESVFKYIFKNIIPPVTSESLPRACPYMHTIPSQHLI